jgi:hypothetical protein
MLSWDLGRVFSAAVLSRCLVLALALASDWAVDDYDTSARWDVPNTGPSCEMSDGDDKIVQARGGARVRQSQDLTRGPPAEGPARARLLPRR